MPQDAHPAANTGRQPRSVLDAEADRNRAFRRAGRYSLWVRTLRYALPLTAVAMFAGYGYLMKHSMTVSFGGGKKLEIERIEINRQALVAHNPRYTGFDKQGAEFEVRSATAEQDLNQKGFVRLNGIEGWIRDQSRARTDLKAVRGTLDTNTNVIELYDRIDLASQNGMTAALTRATVHTKESRIVSEEPVTVSMPTGTVRGNAMTIEQKRRLVLFTGSVVAHLQPHPRSPADPAMRTTQSQSPLGKSGAPVDITSEQLRIDDAAKLATFVGGVVAKQGEAQLESQELEVSYEGQPAGEGGQRKSQMPAASAENSRVRRLAAKGGVTLTRGAEKATGSAGEFDAQTDKAVLMGPVVISAGVDRGATADRAEIDNGSDTILLIGNVVVTQQKNVVKGRRLFADRKNGTVQVSSPANAGLARGQINARLYQAEGDQAAKKQGQPAGKAAGPMGLNVRGDPSQPIDITADVLEVDDKAKTAIFRGKVRALQGDYAINTEELVASYSGEAGLALGPAAAGQPQAVAQAKPTPGQPKAGAQLEKVTSPRVVEIVAKDGQRARGNSAVFDPKANTATLSGDVRLVQGTTITTGSCALLDMTSGMMRVIDACGYRAGPGQQQTSQNGTGKAAATQAAGSVRAPGRAQVLLYPGQFKDDRKQESATNPAARQGAAAPPSPSPTPAAASRPSRPSGRTETMGNVFGQ